VHRPASPASTTGTWRPSSSRVLGASVRPRLTSEAPRTVLTDVLSAYSVSIRLPAGRDPALKYALYSCVMSRHWRPYSTVSAMSVASWNSFHVSIASQGAPDNTASVSPRR